MTQTENLTKTQAATLAEIKRIETTDEPAVEFGIQRKGIHQNALSVLRRKGLIKLVKVEGVGAFAVSA